MCVCVCVCVCACVRACVRVHVCVVCIYCVSQYIHLLIPVMIFTIQGEYTIDPHQSMGYKVGGYH